MFNRDNGTETLTEFSERIGAIAAQTAAILEDDHSSYSTVVQPGQVLSRNVGIHLFLLIYRNKSDLYIVIYYPIINEQC